MNPTVVSRSAELSPCGQYRYLLSRTLASGEGACTFIMLNPSTADGLKDDPTIRRCLGFVQRLGRREMRVVNLFAWRATYPKEMLKQLDPVGPDGDTWIAQACRASDPVICAWGAHSARAVRRRAEAVTAMLVEAGVPLHCLGMSADRHPRHPLFLTHDAALRRWC